MIFTLVYQQKPEPIAGFDTDKLDSFKIQKKDLNLKK